MRIAQSALSHSVPHKGMQPTCVQRTVCIKRNNRPSFIASSRTFASLTQPANSESSCSPPMCLQRGFFYTMRSPHSTFHFRDLSDGQTQRRQKFTWRAGTPFNCLLPAPTTATNATATSQTTPLLQASPQTAQRCRVKLNHCAQASHIYPNILSRKSKSTHDHMASYI